MDKTNQVAVTQEDMIVHRLLDCFEEYGDYDPRALSMVLSEALQAAEQRGAERERERCVKAIKDDAKLCDCFAHSESECACGAWCEWKSITSAQAVEIIRQAVTT